MSALDAPRIARELAARIDQLVATLLPGGHREGHEWRCGSVAGEAGNSLGVHLTGPKAGVWGDFATDQKGDALNLVGAVRHCSIGEAVSWAREWLGIDDGDALPLRRAAPKPTKPKPNPDRWREPWAKARPIDGTLAQTYLTARGLAFADPRGEVLRFASRHFRRNPDGELEHHPALLSDIYTGSPAGTINIYLKADGTDRIRDAKGKTTWGRAAGSAVMLDEFEDITYGLTICEGTETGIALYMAEQRPIWCCGGAGNLAAFPVLPVIEALTVAADAGEPGQKAAAAVAERWQEAGREAKIITPSRDDWAAKRRAAS